MAASRTKAKSAPKRAGSAKSTSKAKPKNEGSAPTWTFLSNHSHVILCLHQDPELTLREVAQRVGITERSVQRILGELEEAGYLARERDGLRNRYRFQENEPLRHEIESHCVIGDLIAMVEKPRR